MKTTSAIIGSIHTGPGKKLTAHLSPIDLVCAALPDMARMMR
jgi:hypothetical protein